MFYVYEVFAAVRNIRKDERGVTALEYGLIAAIVGGAIVTGVGLVSGGLQNIFTDISNRLINTNL